MDPTVSLDKAINSPAMWTEVSHVLPQTERAASAIDKVDADAGFWSPKAEQHLSGRRYWAKNYTLTEYDREKLIEAAAKFPANYDTCKTLASISLKNKRETNMEKALESFGKTNTNSK